MNSLHLHAAHSNAELWRDALDSCLDQLGPLPGANLGFVYFSDFFADEAGLLLEALRQETQIEHWAGSVAYGVCGTRVATRDAPGLSLLVGRFPETGFQVFSGRRPLPRSPHPHFAVVHADPKTPDMADLVADMAAKVDSGFVTGGLSSSRSTTLQIADDVLCGGVSGVAFSSAISVATGVTQGCAPMAGPFEITECEDNVVSKLDDEPALSVYLGALGEDLRGDLRRAAATVLVGLVQPDAESDDYVVRQVVGIDPQSGLLAINATVSPGQKLLLCRRNRRAAEADMRRMLEKLSNALDTPPQGGLYVCCTGRGASLFERDASEVDLIRETFGDLPLAGFFAAGEIAHDRLYGYTGVLTLFA